MFEHLNGYGVSILYRQHQVVDLQETVFREEETRQEITC